MSDDELNDLMDVDFPCGASSSSSTGSTGTSSNNAGATSTAPLIDVTVGGWDNDAISRCFSLSMNYNMHEYSQVQEGADGDREVFKLFETVPNKLLNGSTGLVKDINVNSNSNSNPSININMSSHHQHDCNNMNSPQDHDASDDGACASSVKGTAQESNCNEGQETSGEALQLQPLVGLVLPNWAL